MGVTVDRFGVVHIDGKETDVQRLAREHGEMRALLEAFAYDAAVEKVLPLTTEKARTLLARMEAQ